jgi:Stage II sporulation protein E (SpoIIE)
VIRSLELERHGLRWRRSPLAVAHPQPDGRCAAIAGDVDETAAFLDRFAAGDGVAWRDLYDYWRHAGDPFIDALLRPFPPVRGGARLAAALGPRGLRFALLPAFVTAVVGFWDPSASTFTWTTCGHLKPLLVRGGVVRELSAETTYPLGILERERTLPTATVRLRSGDRLLMHSDGIVEAPLRDGTRFGVHRLQALLTETADQSPSATVASIEREVLDAISGRVGDDATQLLLVVD